MDKIVTKDYRAHPCKSVHVRKTCQWILLIIRYLLDRDRDLEIPDEDINEDSADLRQRYSYFFTEFQAKFGVPYSAPGNYNDNFIRSSDDDHQMSNRLARSTHPELTTFHRHRRVRLCDGSRSSRRKIPRKGASSKGRDRSPSRDRSSSRGGSTSRDKAHGSKERSSQRGQEDSSTYQGRTSRGETCTSGGRSSTRGQQCFQMEPAYSSSRDVGYSSRRAPEYSSSREPKYLSSGDPGYSPAARSPSRPYGYPLEKGGSTSGTTESSRRHERLYHESQGSNRSYPEARGSSTMTTKSKRLDRYGREPASRKVELHSDSHRSSDDSRKSSRTKESSRSERSHHDPRDRRYDVAPVKLVHR